MAQPQLVVRVAGNLEGLKTSLKEGEKAVQTTSAQIQKLATSFNGDRLVAHANNVVAAIKEVGVTTLTASQSARNLDLLERAMDKMARTGEPIPETMRRTSEQLRFMARTTEEAIPPGQQVTAVYKQFDGVLQAMGINIGPYVKGMEDVATAVGGVSTAAGAATTAMGLFASGIAVVATGFGAWKLGEAIGQTSGLTEAIARGTAVLRGYGDVAREEALARADAIDLMGKAEENQKRATKAAEDNARATKEQSDAIKENWRITEGNKDAMARLAEQLDAVREKKRLDAIAAFQASQAQSIFGDETEKTTEKVKEQTSALAEKDAYLKQVADSEAARQKQINDFMNAPTLNDRQAESVSYDVAPLVGYALDDAIRRGTRAGDTGGQGQALKRLMAELEAKEGRYQINNNDQFFAMQRDQALLAQLRALQGSGKIPGFASGVENFAGGLAYVHKGEALVNLPKGTDVVPGGRLGGVTITIAAGAVVLNYPLMDDPRAKHEVVSMLSTALLERVQSAGFLNPSPA